MFRTLQRLHRISLRHYRRSLSTTSNLEKYQYKGPSAKPSIVLRNAVIDTSQWDDIPIVDSDIFVNTPAKAGTTWTQEIVCQLLYNGDYSAVGTAGMEISTWAAMKLPPREHKVEMMEAQRVNPKIPRRVIKTHEPVESLPFVPECKHLFVARDFRDIVWSWYKHHSNINPEILDILNADSHFSFRPLPNFNFSDGSFTEYDMFNMMLSEGDDHGNPDGWPLWSQLWVAGSWWNMRNEPNVKLVHYNNLKADLAGNMREIADFLEIEIDETKFDKLVENCSFSTMKNKKDPLGSIGSTLFKDPAQFFHKGEIRRWKDVLTDKDTERYRAVAKRYLDEEGIHWLETGEY